MGLVLMRLVVSSDNVSDSGPPHCINANDLASIVAAAKAATSQPALASILRQADVALTKLLASRDAPAVDDPDFWLHVLEPLGWLRQTALYQWGRRPDVPACCVNLAIAPTLVHALAILPAQSSTCAGGEVGQGTTLRVQLLGATNDFESRADWSHIWSLFEASSLQVPASIEVTYVGFQQPSFNLGMHEDCFADVPCPPPPAGLTIKSARGLLHELTFPAPDVTLICHPGLHTYPEWYPTLCTLIRQDTTTVLVGHSNAFAFTHDASTLQVAINAFGAVSVLPIVRNPFCQLFHDATRGSMLAPPGGDHTHANMAALAIFRGGQPRGREEVTASLERADFLVQATSAFAVGAGGPPHRDTGLHLKYQWLPPDVRLQAVELLRGISANHTAEENSPDGSQRVGLDKALIDADLAGHFAWARAIEATVFDDAEW